MSLAFSLNGQAIRKNFNEMTDAEKDALVDAFSALQNGSNLLVDVLAEFHGDNFNEIHFNGPSTDIFLAWHRMQILEMELAMQDLDPYLSMPFWDWTVDGTTSSPLWHNDFMGQFDSAWGLSRNLGGSWALPTSGDVNSVQSISTWDTYTDTLEDGIVHAGPHVWIGGIMNTGLSPLDPVFYLHHSMIDKLWQEWVEAHGVTPSSNLFEPASLLGYPGVDPDDVVDCTVFGIFYAENQLAELKDYSVTNANRAVESFYYQYEIHAGNGFVVPSGTSAELISKDKIVLTNGFHAEDGASFVASVDD